MRTTITLLCAISLVTASARARADEPAKEAAPVAPRDDGRQLRFTSGIALTGIGLLGIVTGSVLGVRAIVDKNSIGSHCNQRAECDLAGYTIGSEAQDFALVSTAMFGVGLATAGVGVGLLISALPKKPPTTAWVSLAPRGVTLGLRF